MPTMIVHIDFRMVLKIYFCCNKEPYLTFCHALSSVLLAVSYLDCSRQGDIIELDCKAGLSAEGENRVNKVSSYPVLFKYVCFCRLRKE